MKLFRRAADGGKNSGVTGFFLIEWKACFSIVLLRFAKGSREAFHEHAFNAITLWLKGMVFEHKIDIGGLDEGLRMFTGWPYSAPRFKFTPRNCFHKIEALETSWALSVRGPWVDRWREFRGGNLVTLTHGRKVIN